MRIRPHLVRGLPTEAEMPVFEGTPVVAHTFGTLWNCQLAYRKLGTTRLPVLDYPARYLG